MATLKPKIIWPDLASLPSNLDDSPEVAQIVRLKMQLLSDAKITQKLGAPPGYVSAVLKQYGFARPPVAAKAAARVPKAPKTARGTSKTKTASGTVVTTKRRLEALELRKKGMGFEEIGQALGISKPAAWQLVEGALRDYNDAVKEVSDDLRTLTLMQLDKLLEGHLPAAFSGDDKSAGVVLKTLAERSKIAGLYAAQKTELTGAGGGPLQSVTAATNFDLSKLTDEQLQLMETLMLAAGASAPANPGP